MKYQCCAEHVHLHRIFYFLRFFVITLQICFPSTVTIIFSQCGEQIPSSLKCILEPICSSCHFCLSNCPVCKLPGCAAKRQILSSLQHMQRTPSIAEQQWCFSTEEMRISFSLFPKGNNSARRNLVSLLRSTSVFWRETITHSVLLQEAATQSICVMSPCYLPI